MTLRHTLTTTENPAYRESELMFKIAFSVMAILVAMMFIS